MNIQKNDNREAWVKPALTRLTAGSAEATSNVNSTDGSQNSAGQTGGS